MKTKNQRLGFLLLSIGVYVLSLTQTVLTGWPGWGVLLFGWLGALSLVPANCTWLANVFLFYCWIGIAVSYRQFAMLFSVLAVVFASAFLFCSEVVTGEDGSPIPIEGYFPAYWLWLSSTMVAFAVSLHIPDSPENSSKMP